MDTNSLVGELIEKGQNTTTNVIKTTASDTFNSVSNQIGIKNQTTNTPTFQSQSSQVFEQTQNSNQQNNYTENEFTKEMVQDFYAPSAPISQDTSVQLEEAQTQKRLLDVRQKLHQERHNEVYFNAVLNANSPKHQEERPAEKMERQQMEEIQIKEQKRQNDLPIAVLRAQTQTEMSPGVLG